MMTIAVYLLLLLCVLLLAGAVPTPAVDVLVVFQTPLFLSLLALVGLLCVLAGLGYLRRRWRPRTVFFLAAHLGVVSLLYGAALGYFRGERTQFAAMIGAAPEQALPGPKNQQIPLSFALAVRSFRVESYSPVYHLYEPPAGVTGEHVMLATLRFDRHGKLNLPDESIAAAEMQDAEGGWLSQKLLANGQLLHRGSAVPSHFSAKALIVDPDAAVERQEVAFGVNQPLCYGGWRFYLMSYDTREERYVVLSARRDPGRPWVIAGLWLIIVGCAGLCWQKQPGQKASVKADAPPADLADAIAPSEPGEIPSIEEATP